MVNNNIKTKPLPVKPFQETLGGGYCGPASLKMVLDYYGVKKSEKELARLCGRNARLGINAAAVKKAANYCGFSVKVKNNASLSDIKEWLRKDVPVIVDWFTRGRSDYGDSEVADGHYSIVVGLDKNNIYLQDPEIGGPRKIKRDDFMRVWFDFKGDRITTWKDMIIRQYIAVHRKL